MIAMNSAVFAMPDRLAPDGADLYPEFEHLGPASGFIEEIYQLIEHISLFEDMSRQEVGFLCRYMQCFGAPRNARLLQEGDEGQHLLIILTGNVDVIKDTPNGGRSIAVAGVGSSLGEMSMIDGAMRFASCIATEPTDFAVLTRTALTEIVVDHPRLASKLLLLLLQLMTRRLRDASNLLLPLIAGDAA